MWASFAETLVKILSVIFAGLFSWKAGRDNLEKNQLEEHIEVIKESSIDREEIAKLSDSDLRKRGSNWVRTHD